MSEPIRLTAAAQLTGREWERVLYALDCYGVGAYGIGGSKLPASEAMRLGFKLRDQLREQLGERATRYSERVP